MAHFFGQFFGVVIGSFFTILGIWLTNYFSERKKLNERKIEILESFPMVVTKFVSTLSLSQISEDEKQYCSAILNLPSDGKLVKDALQISLIKDEFPRWVGLIVSNLEKLLESKSELNRLYMSYKIHFEKDEKLKILVNDLILPAQLELKSYSGIGDVQQILVIHQENTKLITSNLKNVIEPKRLAVIEYLDKKIEKLD